MAWLEFETPVAKVLFTDRTGGVSSSPYATANLGLDVGDDPDAVTENRRRAAAAIGVDVGRWAAIRQVHGATVVADASPSGATTRPDADAAVVTTPGRAAVVLTADCAPIALVAPGAVAAVHAGWRGLVHGVVEAAVAEMRRAIPAGTSVTAYVGPTIRPECYEFGAGDIAAVQRVLGPAVAGVTRSGRPALDLVAGLRIALTRAGVTDITDVGLCTACSPDHFSYRRDGVTGRQGVLVARR